MAEVTVGAVMAAVARAVAVRVGSAVAAPAGAAVRRRVFGDPEVKAFASALEEAFAAAQAKHPVVMARYGVEPGFLKADASGELACVWHPGRRPDPFRLAEACIDSLMPGLDVEARWERAAELRPVFRTFLDALGEAVGRRRVLDGVALREGQAAVANGVQRLVERAGVAAATASDVDRYLEWLVDRHRYVHTVGVVKNQTVQLPLDEVFVTLRAEREVRPGDRGRQWFSEEQQRLDRLLGSGQVDHVAYEAALDRLEQRIGGPAHVGWTSQPEVVELTAAVTGSSHLLVLGDPGCGKTTLLRYLALQHASALVAGDGEAAGLGTSEPRFPLFVRIGDFARSPYRDSGLGAFLPAHLRAQECRAPGLDDLVARRLEAGTCLVLLDGLDEVTSAQDRRAVVEAIINFVDAHSRAGNRFVVTSRIAGYLAAPLPPSFASYRVQSMDEPTIHRYLALYCPVIERFHAPDGGEDAVQADAQRTVDELLDAFRANPSVRRLAANPLLLAALVLVHRATGRLPQRRIDAYVEITEALARSWRSAQGVPERELPDDRLLTAWLTRLGGWMHEHHPEGSVSLHKLLAVLGPLWARHNGTSWDPTLLDAADLLDSPAGRGIRVFVDGAERHTGLLVERAPERFGFPHLTFEEYYAGRSLVLEGAAVDGPTRLRWHLHDPRYDEPILLALGLVARDRPEQIDDLVAAIHGPDAEPSPHEDLLGRDFLFTLRVLADDVALATTFIDDVISQAVDEWYDEHSRCRFSRYRTALDEHLSALSGTSAALRLARAAETRLHLHESSPERFCGLAAILARSSALTPPVATVLTTIATTQEDLTVRTAAGAALARAGALTIPVVDAMTTVATDPDQPVLAVKAVEAMTHLKEATDLVADALTTIAVNTHADPAARAKAGRALAADGTLNKTVTESLISIATATDPYPKMRHQIVTELVASGISTHGLGVETWVRHEAISALATGGALTKQVIDDVLAIATVLDKDNSEEPHVIWSLAHQEADAEITKALSRVTISNDMVLRARVHAGNMLARKRALTESALTSLTAIAANIDNDDWARSQAIVALTDNEVFNEDVATALRAIAADETDPWMQAKAGSALAKTGSLDEELVASLTAIATDSTNPGPQSEAASVLAENGSLSKAAITALTATATHDSDASDDRGPVWQVSAGGVLAANGTLNEPVTKALADIATTVDHPSDLRCGAVTALTAATPTPELTQTLVSLLTKDDDEDLRATIAKTLPSWIRQDPTAANHLTNILIAACQTPTPSSSGTDDERPGWDHAYDALWAIIDTPQHHPNR